MKITDKIGQPINEGAFICYSVRVGDTAAMKLGIVERVVELDNDKWDYAQKKYVPTTVYKLKVRPAKEDGSMVMKSIWDPEEKKSVETHKPETVVTLEHLERVVVIKN